MLSKLPLLIKWLYLKELEDSQASSINTFFIAESVLCLKVETLDPGFGDCRARMP